MDGPGNHLTWSVEHKGTTLVWSIDPARIRFRIALLRETAGPHADGLMNYVHRFAGALAEGFKSPQGNILNGIAGDLLLAVAVQRHPAWFETGPTPSLRFSIDPDAPLAVAALAPSSIAIERVEA
jgi:hypothetical protein